MRTALVLLILLASSEANAARCGEDYSPTAGGYSVTFPGKPQETSQTVTTPGGDIKILKATYTVTEGSAYLTSSTDLLGKPQAGQRKTLFDKSIAAIKGSDGKVARQQDVEYGIDKLPARSFTIEKGKLHYRGVLIVKEGRLLQAMVVGSEDFATGKDTDAFFSSFKVKKWTRAAYRLSLLSHKMIDSLPERREFTGRSAAW